MKLAWFLLGVACCLSAQDTDRRVSPGMSGRRLALVIGNQAYPWKPLVNPANDARAVAATLSTTGFAARDVRLVLDARQTELRRAVREFVESVRPGDLAFVYYAGHGVEVRGANYLLPVDLPADSTEGYVQDEAVSAQRILSDLEQHGARVKVLVLDACRDNPLRAVRSAAGGLAPMEGRGSLVLFATEAGRTASDTPGSSNSVFTRYLIEGLRTPGVSLDNVLKRVSRNVARATGEKQVPAIYGLLLEDVVLVGGAPSDLASRLQSVFGAGLGPFRLGMSSREANALLPTPFGDTPFAQLPVATEYAPAEVHYFWTNLNLFTPASLGLNDLQLWSACWQPEFGIVTFLFEKDRLIRISLRLYPVCANRQDLLHRLAIGLGINDFKEAAPVAFRAPAGPATLAGYNGVMSMLDVFTTGSPEPSMSWIVQMR